MLNNLLKTWEILAPDECYLTEIEEPTYSMGDEFCFDIKNSDEQMRWVLQGYIQRCIEGRGWSYQITNYKRLGNSAMVEAETALGFTEFYSCGKFPLLTAYLTALAAQRPVNRGKWQHFKGEVVQVESTATWTTHKIHEFLGDNAFIEESPEEKIQVHLSIDDGDYQRWGYRASKDYGDRVIYVEQNGKRWARKSDVLLGLVDAKHPEYEGLLRFVEVAK